MRGVVVGLVAAMSAAGCVRIPGYACEGDAQCLDRPLGACEPVGFCSYPDDGCDSGRRYSDLSGALADACVPTTTETETDGTETATTVATAGGATTDLDTTTAGSDETGCATDCPPADGGQERWSVTLAGEALGGDVLNAVVVLASGDIAVAGREDTAAGPDALLAVLDTDGNVLSHRTYDIAGGLDELLDVVQGSGGEVWGCGRADPPGQINAWIAEFASPFDDAPSQSVQLGHQVCRTLRQTSNLTMLAAGDDNQWTPEGLGAWAYTFAPWDLEGGTTVFGTTSPDDILYTSATLGDGTVVLGGRLAAGNVSVSPFDNDTVGAPLFEGNAGAIQGIDATVDRVVAGGYEWTANQACAWVAAFAPDGTEHWSWRPASPAPLGDEIEAVAIDGAGNVVAVGFVTTGPRERMMIKLDPSGDELWSKVWPGGPMAADILRDVAILPGDDILVVGELADAEGGLDGWVARLSP